MILVALSLMEGLFVERTLASLLTCRWYRLCWRLAKPIIPNVVQKKKIMKDENIFMSQYEFGYG